MKVQGRGLGELRDDAETAVTVAAAYEAGVFAALGQGAGTTEELSERAGLDPRAVGIVLGALASWGLVGESDGRWEATPECRAALCAPASGAFEGGGLPLWLANVRAIARLGESLRTGRPVDPPAASREEAGVRRFMSAMAQAPAERVRRLVDLCLSRRPGARSVLDVGGGPGHMAREFVGRGLSAVVFDKPETVQVAAEAYGLARVEGLSLAAGDFSQDPLPPGPFDIVLLSNVLHIYGPEANRALLGKVAEVTSPGGVAAIAEFLRGRSPRAARFALVMLVRTEAGNVYSEESYRSWLEGAGFGDARVDDLDPERQLVTAVKATATGATGSAAER